MIGPTTRIDYRVTEDITLFWRWLGATQDQMYDEDAPLSEQLQCEKLLAERLKIIATIVDHPGYQMLEQGAFERIRDIDSTDMWEARAEGDHEKQDELAIERTGIIRFFSQINAIPTHIKQCEQRIEDVTNKLKAAQQVEANPDLTGDEDIDS